MGVALGGGFVGVPEIGADFGEGLAGSLEASSEGVAQTVERDSGNVDALEDATVVDGEPLGGRRVEPEGTLLGEYEPGIGPALLHENFGDDLPKLIAADKGLGVGQGYAVLILAGKDYDLLAVASEGGPLHQDNIGEAQARPVGQASGKSPEAGRVAHDVVILAARDRPSLGGLLELVGELVLADLGLGSGVGDDVGAVADELNEGTDRTATGLAGGELAPVVGVEEVVDAGGADTGDLPLADLSKGDPLPNHLLVLDRGVAQEVVAGALGPFIDCLRHRKGATGHDGGEGGSVEEVAPSGGLHLFDLGGLHHGEGFGLSAFVGGSADLFAFAPREVDVIDATGFILA